MGKGKAHGADTQHSPPLFTCRLQVVPMHCLGTSSSSSAHKPRGEMWWHIIHFSLLFSPCPLLQTLPGAEVFNELTVVQQRAAVPGFVPRWEGWDETLSPSHSG